MKAYIEPQKNTSLKARLMHNALGMCSATLGFILFLLPFHAFLSTWLGTVVGPLLFWKSWKELLLLALVPPCIMLGFLHRGTLKALWQRPINKVIVFYVLLHIVLAIFSQASADAVFAGLAMNLRFLAIFLLAQFLVLFDHPWIATLKLLIPQWLLVIMGLLGIMAILQVTILPKDFLTHFGYDTASSISPFLLVDNNPDAQRAFATMRGPNTLGAFLLLPLGIAVYYIWNRRQLWLSGTAFVLGMTALFLTGSRSAWLGFAVMCGTLAILWLPRVTIKRFIRRWSLPVVVVLSIFLWAAINVPALRLAVFHSSPGDASLLEGSSEQHWLATAAGVGQITTQPFGQGVGTAGPASFYNSNATANISENYFVQIGQEVGLLGLLVFIGVCMLIGRQLLLQKHFMTSILLASFIGLSFINLLLHGWADDPTAMTWWAVAGLFITWPLSDTYKKAKS